jgi:hypothetical protein
LAWLITNRDQPHQNRSASATPGTNHQRAHRADAEIVEVPDQGHAPLLDATDLIQRVAGFIAPVQVTVGRSVPTNESWAFAVCREFCREFCSKRGAIQRHCPRDKQQIQCFSDGNPRLSKQGIPIRQGGNFPTIPYGIERKLKEVN